MWLSIWALKKSQTTQKKEEKINSRTKNKDYRSQVVIPYVLEILETVHQVIKKYRVVTVMCPHTPPSDTCW